MNNYRSVQCTDAGGMQLNVCKMHRSGRRILIKGPRPVACELKVRTVKRGWRNVKVPYAAPRPEAYE
jgi:hypothetical protein